MWAAHSTCKVRGMRKLIVLMCLAGLTVGSVSAKEVMRKSSGTTTKTTVTTMNSTESSNTRIGLGFSQQLSDQNLSSMAARFWVTPSYGFEGLFGFQFGDDRIIDFGGKFLGALRHEQNLTVYGFGLLGIENTEFKNTNNEPGFNNSESQTMTTFGFGLGVEFFFQGLPNLSFMAETGLGYRNPSSGGSFGTTSSFMDLGLRYYLN